MEDFFLKLLGQFLTWQTLFLAVVVMFLTETLKKSTSKFLKIWLDKKVAEKRLEILANPTINGDEAEHVEEMTKVYELRNDGIIDFLFSWIPIVLALIGSIYIDELFGGHSLGMRACYGIIAGAGSSLLYRIVKQLIKYYINKLKK